MELTDAAEPDDGQAQDPVDEGLSTRPFAQAQNRGKQAQDARGGAKAQSGNQDQLQGDPHEIDFAGRRRSLALLFELPQTIVCPLERFGGSVALGFEASQLLALVAVLVASVLGFALPLVSAAFDFGKLAHDRLALLGSGEGHGPVGASR